MTTAEFSEKNRSEREEELRVVDLFVCAVAVISALLIAYKFISGVLL